MGGQIIKKCVPSSGNLYHFENLKEAISSIRTIQQDEWATEANIGYDYHIAIFEDLENECLILKWNIWDGIYKKHGPRRIPVFPD